MKQMMVKQKKKEIKNRFGVNILLCILLATCVCRHTYFLC